jgi:hypothetical protein
LADFCFFTVALMEADPLLVNGNAGRNSPGHASRRDEGAQGTLSRSVPSFRREAPSEARGMAARRGSGAAFPIQPIARPVIA